MSALKVIADGGVEATIDVDIERTFDCEHCDELEEYNLGFHIAHELGAMLNADMGILNVKIERVTPMQHPHAQELLDIAERLDAHPQGKVFSSLLGWTRAGFSHRLPVSMVDALRQIAHEIANVESSTARRADDATA